MNGIEYIMIVVSITVIEAIICAFYGVWWMKRNRERTTSREAKWLFVQLFGYTVLAGALIFAIILTILCLIYG